MMLGDQYTRAEREALTDQQLTAVLRGGRLVCPLPETPDYYPIVTYKDKYTAIWFKLMRYDKWLAMIDGGIVRAQPSVYLPRFEAFAARTGRKFQRVDTLNFPGNRSPSVVSGFEWITAPWNAPVADGGAVRPSEGYIELSQDPEYNPNTFYRISDDAIRALDLSDIPF